MINKIFNKIKSKYKNIVNVQKVTKTTKTTKTAQDYHNMLNSLKDKFKGERCFILGNGPSLNKCDLSFLKNEYSFAVNGIFYKTNEMGYKPNFYMVEDNHVVYDNLKKINAYKCDYKFFPASYKDHIIPDETTIFIPADFGFYRENHPYYCKPRFSKNIANEIFTGQSVTIMQLQMAYHLGFSEVYLIGMDFSYALPSSTIVEGVNYTSQEDDVNHFHPDYFGKGKKWHDPKLDRVLMNYENCKLEFERDGRKIFNATTGGELNIFERKEFVSLF